MRKTPKKLTRAFAGVAGLALVGFASPAFAAATLEVSKTTGLADGDQITVSGTGFKPGLASIAVGQCKEGMTGPVDCNTATGATFVTADANGNIKELSLVMKEEFKGINCSTQKCIIGAQPLPNAVDAETLKANTVYYDISFGAAAADPAPAETPAPAPAPAPAPTPGDTTTSTTAAGELPKTGAGETLGLALGGGLLLLAGGVAALRMTPRRNEGVA
ncbi:neocarzinostatin apoprotein domain-containing protein [Nocardioides yefusunii]|uniref:Neocarzinostatin apoprotein domain-containing protein n=1 Tax=Nocardioides yefusunii TaxID=2500546 RepID=A0ABW1QTQ9_9ACTN|nr:neocarzinostatin apoprotein domain-containing protein [Nocardioides yefusunii]